MFEDAEHIEKALHGGAAGYVVKSINPLDLPSTIRQDDRQTPRNGAPHDGDGDEAKGYVYEPCSRRSLGGRRCRIIQS
jgi:hypothetical protein